jgi:hypothetical protein
MSLDFWASLGYSTTILDNFSSIGGSGSQAINATGGRTGGPSLRFTSTSGAPSVRGSLLTSGQTRWAPVAIRISALPSLDRTILQLLESATVQVDLRITPEGKLRVTRSGTTLATSTNQVVFANVYFQVEPKVKIDNSTGTVDVRLNGDSAGILGLVGLTGLDTQITGNALIDSIAYCNIPVSGSGSETLDFCHMLVRNDDWSGDAHVDYFPSNGAGNYAQWTPLSSTNVSQIDESGSPNTADYNLTDTVGDKDSFTHGSILATSTPIAVCPVMLVNKQDAGGAQLKFLLRQGGTDYNPGAALNPPLGSNQYVKECFTEDPDTAAPWIGSGVNSVETGYERTA